MMLLMTAYTHSLFRLYGIQRIHRGMHVVQGMMLLEDKQRFGGAEV